MEGQITKIISDRHVVNSNGKVINCKCRGRFRNDNILPLVGDYVVFDFEKEVIEEILPRKNSFKRPSVANIDEAFIVTSLKQPDFSTNLLDKLISVMELHNVEPIICITKSDLIKEDKLKEIKKTLKYYEKIGYKVVFNSELDKIRDLLKNKTCVFTGQTGAGKSTLLNKLNDTWNLETGEISISLGRGKHTTRVVELFEFLGGKVLDTPGFSALDFNDYTKGELRDSFIEFKKFSCIYKDCMHTNEKECKVKIAVEENKILASRYKNYLNILERR